jgi:tetratricopeptide (TPR) repeat protein
MMSLNTTAKLVFVCYLSFSTLTFANAISSLGNAITVLKTGQTEQAIVLFEKQKHDPDAMIYLAKIYMDTDLDEAEAWIEKALKANLKDAEAHYVRGAIMGRQASGSIFSALSYAEKSVNSFTKAVELQPDSIKYRKGLMQFHTGAPSIAGGDLCDADSKSGGWLFANISDLKLVHCRDQSQNKINCPGNA